MREFSSECMSLPSPEVIICKYKIHIIEYSTKYRKPDVLKHLRFTCDKAKLLEEDMNNDSERLLLCHITRVGTPTT